jgi:hypothetical protein
MTLLAENLERLEAEIAEVCRRAGRQRTEVELMAVSKTYPAETLAEAAALGLTLFGENRVQEFAGKAPYLAQIHLSDSLVAQHSSFVTGHDFSRAAENSESIRALAPEVKSTKRTDRIRVHLIGHLQSNKAQRTVELFDGVDSLDSPRLAERLNEAAGKLGKLLPVLIEVKLSHEESKAGIDPHSAEASELLERLPEFAHLQLQGLMTIAPFGVSDDATRACFRSLREWRERWAASHPRLCLDVLSMGMSGDFDLAIEEGATRIRVGTSLFGSRPALGKN